jgi:hypothetical protein
LPKLRSEGVSLLTTAVYYRPEVTNDEHGSTVEEKRSKDARFFNREAWQFSQLRSRQTTISICISLYSLLASIRTTIHPSILQMFLYHNGSYNSTTYLQNGNQLLMRRSRGEANTALTMDGISLLFKSNSRAEEPVQLFELEIRINIPFKIQTSILEA